MTKNHAGLSVSLAGLVLLAFYVLTYIIYRSFLLVRSRQKISLGNILGKVFPSQLNPITNMELSEELQPQETGKPNDETDS